MIHPSFHHPTRRERPPLYPVQDRRIQFIPKTKTKTREIYFKGERGDRWAPHHHHPHHATATVPAEAYTSCTLRQRAHRASHPSCTTPTTPKQTNVTLHPAADGSTRITSPRILTSASAFAGISPPRRRRSALVGSPSRTTSCALSLFQSLMVSSIDKVGSRVGSSYYSIRR